MDHKGATSLYYVDTLNDENETIALVDRYRHATTSMPEA